MDTENTIELCTGINKRIVEVRGELTQIAFAHRLGVSKITVARYEKGERLPDADFIARLCETFCIDYTWLITGKGSRNESDKYIQIPNYDFSVSAGPGCFLDDSAQPEMVMVDKNWLRNELFVQPKDAYLVTVSGDSMMPTINDRDKLLVTSNVEGFRDGIYIMRYDSLLNVKRLQRQPGKKVRVTSDNPAYEPFDVDLNDESVDFCLLGKVVWIVRRSAF